MSLPAGQQRVLDGIAEALRVSEPRLVSMFATFTRLTRNEAAPGQEQLPRQRLLNSRAGLEFRRWLRGARRRRSLRWRHVLLLTHLMMCVAVAGLLVAMGSGATAGCGRPSQRLHAVTRVGHGTRCRVQAGPVPAQPGGK